MLTNKEKLEQLILVFQEVGELSVPLKMSPQGMKIYQRLQVLISAINEDIQVEMASAQMNGGSKANEIPTSDSPISPN